MYNMHDLNSYSLSIKVSKYIDNHDDTPEIQDEIQDDTPEIQNHTLENQYDTPEIQDDTPEIENDTPEIHDTPKLRRVYLQHYSDHR